MFGFRNKNQSGAIVVSGMQIGYTTQCVHCGSHETIIKGSGTTRGHCLLCKGFLCGRKDCMEKCIPYEARIEYQEALSDKHEGLLKKLVNRYPGIQELRL